MKMMTPTTSNNVRGRRPPAGLRRLPSLEEVPPQPITKPKAGVLTFGAEGYAQGGDSRTGGGGGGGPQDAGQSGEKGKGGGSRRECGAKRIRAGRQAGSEPLNSGSTEIAYGAMASKSEDSPALEAKL